MINIQRQLKILILKLKNANIVWSDYGSLQDLINIFYTYSYDIKYTENKEKL